MDSTSRRKPGGEIASALATPLPRCCRVVRNEGLQDAIRLAGNQPISTQEASTKQGTRTSCRAVERLAGEVLGAAPQDDARSRARRAAAGRRALAMQQIGVRSAASDDGEDSPP